MVFQPFEVSHFSVYDPRKHNTPVHLALNALAMEVLHAVEIAQQSHFNLLSFSAHSLLSTEFACFRRPAPRAPTWELLAIDDHLVAQKIPLEQVGKPWPARDSVIFEKAEAAYSAAGLHQRPDKRQRGVSAGQFLGAEVDGVLGLVSAPRHRLGILMLLTAIVKMRGHCTPAVLSCLTGLWVHVLMFRRPGLALMNAVFQDTQLRPLDKVIRLSRDSVNELQSLVWLAPLFVSDLRCSYVPSLFALDASPSASGMVSAPLAESIVAELWRHGEQRGYYTRLESPATAILRELGLETEAAFGATPVDHPSLDVPVPASLREGFLFDCVELFSGEAHWTDAHARAGLHCHAGFDFGP